MQLEAMYREGQIHFTTPIRLKNHPIRVRIDVPDDEIDSVLDQPEVQASAGVSAPGAAPGFIDELKDIQSLVRAQLQSAANRPLDKDALRDLRAQAWEDKHRG